ncbi:MAG: L-seryl-tRNA(Sec) selenium transferase, partial [Deltaproteobacteria bacterium]
ELIKEIGQNPITRAVRIDKLTLAALEATLTFYLEPKEAIKHIPTLKMILMDDKRIHNKARLLYKKIDPKIKAKFHVEIKKEFSQVGGGALPLLDLPTRVIVFHPTDISTEELDLQLRQATPPIIGRIKADEFLLDMRTIRDEEIKEIPQILSKIFLSR